MVRGGERKGENRFPPQTIKSSSSAFCYVFLMTHARLSVNRNHVVSLESKRKRERERERERERTYGRDGTVACKRDGGGRNLTRYAPNLMEVQRKPGGSSLNGLSMQFALSYPGVSSSYISSSSWHRWWWTCQGCVFRLDVGIWRGRVRVRHRRGRFVHLWGGDRVQESREEGLLLSSLTGTGKVPTGWNSYCSHGMPSRHCDSKGLRFSGQRRRVFWKEGSRGGGGWAPKRVSTCEVENGRAGSIWAARNAPPRERWRPVLL